MFRRLRGRRIWFQIVLTGIFVGILIWRVNLVRVFQTFAHVNYLWVLPALGCFSASKFIHAYRWQLLLAETEEAPLLDLFAIYLVSNMANNAVPFRIGDVIRIQVPAQRFGIPRAELAAAVFVAETVLDGFTFLILTLVVLSFIHVAILPTGLALGLAAADHARLSSDRCWLLAFDRRATWRRNVGCRCSRSGHVRQLPGRCRSSSKGSPRCVNRNGRRAS